MVCASFLSALNIIINQPDIRNKLKQNITYFQAGLLKIGQASNKSVKPKNGLQEVFLFLLALATCLLYSKTLMSSSTAAAWPGKW